MNHFDILGSVFCCNFEPKQNKLVVSGGEDDKAFVWDSTDGRIVLECTGHRDSVTNASFSYDGVYLATADMGGFIQGIFGFTIKLIKKCFTNLNKKI